MAHLLVLSANAGSEVLPALSLLPHKVREIEASPANIVNSPSHDLVFLDARRDLAGAKALARIMQTTGLSVPMIVVVTEGGLAAMSSEWGADDIVLDTAGPGEVDARIRLSLSRKKGESNDELITSAGVVIDEASYSARVDGRPMDLTLIEFELLKYLMQHPGRVFSRAQLLSEVWGYGYAGETRTVDVHIRRLRAKLGDRGGLIGTEYGRGYRFNLLKDEEKYVG
jgi:DNA-binding response OmpR family regulator